LARAKGKAQGIVCLSNIRQLTLAWNLYASDNADHLVYNFGAAGIKKTVAANQNLNWVNDVMSWELDGDNTNLTLITNGQLAPYAARAAGIFKCPSDNVVSDLQRQAGWTARVRSVSMNAMVGDAGEFSWGGTNVFNPTYVQFMKLSDILQPGGIFVFLDEHPDSINDGYFINRVDQPEWVHLPASFHNGAGGFTFADGHAEVHKWINAATRRPSRPDGAPLPFPVQPSDDADYQWLVERTTIDR